MHLHLTWSKDGIFFLLNELKYFLKLGLQLIIILAIKSIILTKG